MEPSGMYRRRLLSLGDRAYGMPGRLQDAAGSRNRLMDEALEAAGIPLATSLETVAAVGYAVRVQTTPPTV